jgi:hypothetical protein
MNGEVMAMTSCLTTIKSPPPLLTNPQLHRKLLIEDSSCVLASTNMSGKVEDKKGNPIEEGDTVFTKIRGGKREGEVRFL